ncbi:MAG TPA: hypothetical protein GXX30_09840 [Firmicutes bacterium]|nr:hypothetical protein [Candidatus Fermentithermobacillaceae bacterium]
MSIGSNGYPWWTGDYQSADWVRVDFHLHTPGVDSFRYLSGLDLEVKPTGVRLSEISQSSPAAREVVIDD